MDCRSSCIEQLEFIVLAHWVKVAGSLETSTGEQEREKGQFYLRSTQGTF